MKEKGRLKDTPRPEKEGETNRKRGVLRKKKKGTTERPYFPTKIGLVLGGSERERLGKKGDKKTSKIEPSNVTRGRRQEGVPVTSHQEEGGQGGGKKNYSSEKRGDQKRNSRGKLRGGSERRPFCNDVSSGYAPKGRTCRRWNSSTS